MIGGIGYTKNAYEMTNPMMWNTQYSNGIQNKNKMDDKLFLEENGIQKKQAQKTKETECQTCKERKYVDGSNESNVSFKAPAHISPENSAAVVMSHEQEHVANAKKEGSKENAELLSATVVLKMGVCPECGRTYVEGGTTKTTIRYSEENPYAQNKKAMEKEALLGNAVDIKV